MSGTWAWLAAIAGIVVLAASGSSGSSTATTSQPRAGGSGTVAARSAGQGQAASTVPVTPDVPTDMGALSGGVRRFDLTASAFRRKIANFPLRTATVWATTAQRPGRP